MEFQSGKDVEVNMREEGLEGSYYAAKIISKEGSAQYKVEYKTLLKEDESGRLQEIVDANQLRPLPPQVAKNCFSLHEVADVYVNDGWWTGIIWGRFQADYFLYFPTTGEEKPFPLDELRLHQEWSNGVWTCPKWYELDLGKRGEHTDEEEEDI